MQVGGVFLAVALIFFVITLDLLPNGLEDLMTRAWPAILIILGLSFLLRGRVAISGLISIVVSLGLVAGVALVAYSSRATQFRDDQQLTISQPIEDDITLLAVNVDTLSTDVEILAGTQNDVITGEFVGSAESDIILTYEAFADGRAEFTLLEQQSGQFPMLEAVGRGTLRLELPPQIGLAIAFTGQEAETTFNLNDTELERLSFTLESGDVLVTLPDHEPRSPNAQDDPGELVVENGDIVIIVPEGVAARLELNRGGNNIRPIFDERYILIDDGADGTIEKRDVDEGDVPLFYEITAPGGQITLQVSDGESE